MRFPTTGRMSLSRWLRRLSLRNALLLAALLTVIVNEYAVYWVQGWRWPSVPLESRDAERDLVLLLVADPQIQGYQDEPSFPVGTITRWDSDRYLSKTFSMAFSHAQPDVVVVLGDIMDEGSKALPLEYDDYLHRIHNIFYPAQSTKFIYVPGDNDIGGEGGDFRTASKIQRFEKHFENLTGVVRHSFVDFIKVDVQFHRLQPPERHDLVKQISTKLTKPMRIIINHESVLPKMKRFIYPLLKQIQPNLIITGHWHVPRHFLCDDCLSENEDDHHWPVHQRESTGVAGFEDISLQNPLGLHELMVPTCSYRMGVPEMGYGVAVITDRGSLIKYAVLWLPSRYIQLYAYAVILVVLLISLCAVQLLCPPRQVTFSASSRW